MNAPTGSTSCPRRSARRSSRPAASGGWGSSSTGRRTCFPVNYAADATGKILYRTTADSLLATVGGQSVVFEVDGFDETAKTRLERLRPRRGT